MVAFDKERTLPNLLGCLLSQAKADLCVFVPSLTCWTPFERRHNFVVQSILPHASLFVGRVGRFKLYCCFVYKLFC